MKIVKDRLAELIKAGGVISLQTEDAQLFELILAGALWRDDPTRLRWCNIFPEHQGNIHETRYDEAALENDGRDVVFRRAGVRVAGVVPYVEAGTYDTDEVAVVLAEWRELVAYGSNAADFDHFLRTA